MAAEPGGEDFNTVICVNVGIHADHINGEEFCSHGQTVWESIFEILFNGCQGLPSLSDRAVQSIPHGLFAPNDKLEGYCGRGLTTHMISVMEVLVTTSVRVEHDELPRRVPLPECFLHYNNTNNSDSGDGWLRHGCLPLLGTTKSLDDDIATVRVRYQRLVQALHRCMIFRASHLDDRNSTTMYTQFQFKVEDHASILPPPPEPMMMMLGMATTNLDSLALTRLRGHRIQSIS
jgi:hypothetical protein